MLDKQLLILVSDFQQQANLLHKQIIKVNEALANSHKEKEFKEDFSFSYALDKLKEDRRVSRRCWRNENVFLFLNKPTLRTRENFICVKTLHGFIVPWCPNHNELLGDDWYLVE